MYLFIEENPNCPNEERAFSDSGQARVVTHLQVEGPNGDRAWYEVTGVEDNETFSSAHAIQVEDSGAGNAWLIFGGLWGLRFRPENSPLAWSLSEKSQWGTPFKVLDISGEDIRFTTAAS